MSPPKTNVSTSPITTPRQGSRGARGANYRYGVVFILVSSVVVFAMVAPEGRLSRAVAFALVAAALLVTVITSREPTSVRRRRAMAEGVVTTILTLGIAVGVVPRDVMLALSVLLILAVPVTLVRGLLRLVREQGATLQAVAGALAIYLLVGLGFASIIGFIAAVGPGHYFTERTSGGASDNIYFSFTVLTTTGFGDLTAAQHVGRALAVIEMLVGQLYLVTVIGILIGRRVEKAR